MGDTEKSDPHAVRFRAFVSYSHVDAAIAQKLHRKIETYRLPQHLRDRETDDPDNGRLGRIFRDREDLPAAEDLSESVKQALAGSQVLVVICSPDAQASIWVTREIELFRSLHPGRPVLAALVRGEPEEAFPAALRDGTEPLAADLRKEGDGWRLGFLKIIAGIAGVPLDALVQRDATRRIRRVMAVTGGALVALLAMVGMTIFALQSRNEAQHQQAEAEGLVEYMLTDLRTELKGRTTVRVMTKVNERALKYYSTQVNLSEFPAESLERRARILHAMGEDFEKQGNLNEALASFSEAHAATKALLERAPSDADRIFAHAQSEYWAGFAAWQDKNIATAEKHWRAYLDQAKALVKVEPNTIRSFMELGYSHGNLCELNMADNQNVEVALRHCESAIGFEKKALQLEPGNVVNAMALANRYGWMADALSRTGRYDEALKQRNLEQTILNQLISADPENGQLLLRQTWPEIGKGDIERQRGQPMKAVKHFNSVLQQLINLTEKFPDNQHILAVHIRTEMLLADTKQGAAMAGWKEHKQNARDLFETAKRGAEGAPVRRMVTLLEH